MCIKAGNEKRVTQRALFQSGATVRSLTPAAAQHLREVTNTSRCKSCSSPTPVAPAAACQGANELLVSQLRTQRAGLFTVFAFSSLPTSHAWAMATHDHAWLCSFVCTVSLAQDTPFFSWSLSMARLSRPPQSFSLSGTLISPGSTFSSQPSWRCSPFLGAGLPVAFWEKAPPDDCPRTKRSFTWHVRNLILHDLSGSYQQNQNCLQIGLFLLYGFLCLFIAGTLNFV